MFDPPFFYERKVMYGHMMVILITLEEFYVHICMVPILDLPKCLFGAKEKKLDFWPHKSGTFFLSYDFGIFW